MSSAEYDFCGDGPFGGYGSGGGGDGGGGTASGTPPGSSPSQGRGRVWTDNETLGLPRGLNLRPATFADLLGLSPGTQCDFGFCRPVGNGLTGVEEIGAVACLADPLCAAVAIGVTVAVVGIELYKLHHQTQTQAPSIPSGDCIRISQITEGNSMKCFYQCPGPGGTTVEKWKYSTTAQGCPEVESESNLRQ
jgi:hypothetical protein